jgi:DNA-binding MurR/RpiR family transcriptional regulator
MATGNDAQLADLLRERADETKHLSCTEAFKVAEELGISPAEVGKGCNELGIKIVACQLGCF